MEDYNILNNENFKKWFGKSAILDDNDDPLVLYHGTTADFYKFDLNKTNHEAFAGSGFYFSSSLDDATNNYASINGPDFLVKKENFIEEIQSMADSARNTNEEEIREATDSQANFNNFIQTLVEENESYIEKLTKIRDYIHTTFLILPEDQNESKKYLENAFFQMVEQKNDGIVHSVYLKMEKPFYLETHQWEKAFEVSDSIRSIFDNFIKLNSDSENLVSELLNNLQYYADHEDENYLSIDKNAFFESIDVNLDDLIDGNSDHYVYSQEILENLSKYWDENIGESEYLCGNFTNNNIVEQFKSYITNNYGHILCGQDLKEIKNLYIDEDFEVINSGDFFQKISENLPYFMDYSHEGLSASGVFFDFIYSLGFDGIVMDTKRFANMNLDYGVTHYIVKNSNQIKLADGLNKDFSEYNDDIRFKKVLCKPNLCITQDEAFAKIEEFHLAFPSLPYTRIFQTQKDLEKITKTKDKVAGFYYNEGNFPFVGVVLENIKSKQELEKVLVHEHLGHASLRTILGTNFENTMMSIYQYLKKNNAIEINSTWTKSQKIEAAEEFFANSMETKNQFTTTILSKVVSAVAKSIRSVFSNFPFSKDEFSVLQQKSYIHSKKSKVI